MTPERATIHPKADRLCIVFLLRTPLYPLSPAGKDCFVWMSQTPERQGAPLPGVSEPSTCSENAFGRKPLLPMPVGVGSRSLTPRACARNSTHSLQVELSAGTADTFLSQDDS